MLDSIQALLDAFPEGVVQLRGETVLAANAMARRYLPRLEPGAPCPASVSLPRNGSEGAGAFAEGGGVYTYSCTKNGTEWIILFRPAPQTALTGGQMEGVLAQLRALLGEVLAEVGPATVEDAKVPAAAFGKSFHRMLRLVGNVDYLQRAAGEEKNFFHPVTMDLEGLCRDTVRRAYPLLKEAGVELDYESSQSGLLIPGDPELLQRLLLELIANAARAAGEGRVTLALRRQGERALLSVSHNGPLPDSRQITALFQQEGNSGDLPLPGQGAGLGMSIARDVVSLHQGSLLVEWGQSAPAVVLSLPVGPSERRLSVRTPAFQRDGGLDPVLIQLSDLLPAHVFGLEGMD